MKTSKALLFFVLLAFGASQAKASSVDKLALSFGVGAAALYGAEWLTAQEVGPDWTPKTRRVASVGLSLVTVLIFEAARATSTPGSGWDGNNAAAGVTGILATATWRW